MFASNAKALKKEESKISNSVWSVFATGCHQFSSTTTFLTEEKSLNSYWINKRNWCSGNYLRLDFFFLLLLPLLQSIRYSVENNFRAFFLGHFIYRSSLFFWSLLFKTHFTIHNFKWFFRWHCLCFKYTHIDTVQTIEARQIENGNVNEYNKKKRERKRNRKKKRIDRDARLRRRQRRAITTVAFTITTTLWDSLCIRLFFPIFIFNFSTAHSNTTTNAKSFNDSQQSYRTIQQTVS